MLPSLVLICIAGSQLDSSNGRHDLFTLFPSWRILFHMTAHGPPGQRAIVGRSEVVFQR